MNRSLVPLSFPCGQDFATMQADGTQRLCASCDRYVHDLSKMTAAERFT